MSAESTIVNNTLRSIPGTRDWTRVDEVAERIVADLKSAGAVISWPNGEPDVKAITKTDQAFKRLVDMDRADRPLN